MKNHTLVFDPEDPRLTAYALGELHDPAERAAIEQTLQASPEARAALQEIRELTAALSAEYEQERHTAADAPRNVITMTPARAAWPRRLLLAAAMLLLMAAVAQMVFNGRVQRSAVFAVTGKLSNASPGKTALPVLAPEHPITPASTLQQIAAAAPMPPLDALDSTKVPPLDKAAPLVASASVSRRDSEDARQTFTLPATASGHVASVTIPSAPTVLKGQMSVSAGTLQFSSAKDLTPSGSASDDLQVGRDNLALAATASRMPQTVAPMNGGAVAQPATRSDFGTAKGSSLTLDQTRVTASGSTDRTLKGVNTYTGATTVTNVLTVPPASAPEARYAFAKQAALSDAEPMPLAPGLERPVERPSTAVYEHRAENPFLAAKDNPLSTFSIDVDTASYANVRRFIESGRLPPPDAVRIEELINYFPSTDAPPAPGDEHPFAVHLEAASCPWNPQDRLVRIGIKGREMARDKRPPSNLVFLLDVSGSMEPPERLPLIQASMRLLVEQLREDDRVAIVTYAGESGVALPSTTGDHKERILAVLNALHAGGSTNGASGITLAYKVAREGFIPGGTNRVILATDGDFNVGVTNQNDLVRLIQREAKSGVALSALGVGTDNYKDAMMQKLADKGNGNYHYIDQLDEARKVLVEQMSGTLVTIAKDVKIQVEFNPATVAAYRLIGYEKRMLRKEDFNDDRVDAGEIGAGHSVTALYEVVPAGGSVPQATPAVDALKYGEHTPAPVVSAAAPVAAVEKSASRELLTVKMRHKAPDGDRSERSYEQSLIDAGASGDFANASADFKFAAAVASFGLALRDSPNKGGASLGAAIELAQEGVGADAGGYRAGFIELARRAQAIQQQRGE